MKHFTFFLVAVATMAGLVAVVLIAPAPGRANGQVNERNRPVNVH